MRILIFILLIVFNIKGEAQNGVPDFSVFVLPKGQDYYSCKILNDSITYIDKVDLNLEDRNSISETGILAQYSTNEGILKIIELSENGKVKKSQSYKNPFQLKTEAIISHRNQIFLGGSAKSEILVKYNYLDGEWKNVPIPKEYIYQGKSIDDFLIFDTILIALDNVVVPKYLFFYNIQNFDSTSVIDYMLLNNNGPYESYRKAIMGDNYICFLSKTYGGYSKSNAEYISVYDRADLSYSFSISSFVENWKFLTFTDIAIVGDELYIACTEKGLGKFKIEKEYFDTKSKYGIEDFNKELNYEKIVFKSFEKGQIIKLTYRQKDRVLIVTYKNKSSIYENEIVKCW